MKKVLIVDDDATTRFLIASILSKRYQTLQANNGQEAVERFAAETPDIVLLDALMPVMDGLEACRRIKAQCPSNKFVPVVFITSLSDAAFLRRFLAAGGDDFLVKPIHPEILLARLEAMQRLINLNREFLALHVHLQHEQEIAEKVFSRVVLAGNQIHPTIQTWFKPAQTFSGDMFLAEYAANGDLHLLLADFTGHGLAAALGAIPASQVFRAMTSKGFASKKILQAINYKLKDLLPTGIFMSALYLVVHQEIEAVTVCNCGMPDLLIKNAHSGSITARVASSGLPLGIVVGYSYERDWVRLPLSASDYLILASDGIIEAENTRGEMLGEARFIAWVEQLPAGQLTEGLVQRMADFCGDARQHDDWSLIVIPYRHALFDQTHLTLPTPRTRALLNLDLEEATPGLREWEYHLTLEGRHLAKVNPVPVIIGQLQELENLDQHHQALYTILTELYVNALDHGILGLDSRLKTTAEGFARYFIEREQRLAQLYDGRIIFSCKKISHPHSAQIHIVVEDSGPGFDVEAILKALDKEANAHLFCGRGIFLVKELCLSLDYTPPGNRVEAIYAWPLTPND